MRKPGNHYWEVVALSAFFSIIILTGSAVWFKHQVTSEQLQFILQLLYQFIGPLIVISTMLLVVIGVPVLAIFRRYILPTRRIADEISLINSSNPAHRIRSDGGAEIRRLCERINEWAQRYESLTLNIEEKIHRARADSDQEKNTLAAIMAELPEGVVICNTEGRILLYNNRARQLLTGTADPPQSNQDDKSPSGDPARYIGLGRSVYGIIEKNLIAHALDQINLKLREDDPEVVSYFVVPGADERLLRVEAVPVLDAKRRYTGLILIFNDITRQLETDSHLNLALESFSRGIRASLAGIRSAIETIIEFPQMEARQLEALKGIILKESLVMGEILESQLPDNTRSNFSQWPLITMSAKDLADLLKSKAVEKLQVDVQVENFNPAIKIKIDSYSFLLVLVFVIDKLKTLIGFSGLTCRLKELDWYVGFDLLWQGAPVEIGTLREWEEQPLVFEEEGMTLTLREIIDHHAADIGSYPSKQLKGRSYLRFFMPVVDVTEPDAARSLTILPESRPEFYDFDLFGNLRQVPELEDRPLTDLTYTVFDMETTGLNPAGGDEIISIGAFRMVNCRLLRDECFEQLVDPQRSIPWTSVKIHGIHPEMLIGQPLIDQVVPQFHQFAEDTIMVAHNAAFDMRFLQLKEARTGAKFVNPVLDTLLLSAVIHPSHENHDLEAISQRLGVRIIGRHTALGDASATGEIFLKMLPLLARQGIYTLKEALTASQKTYYARQKF
ncbi:DNA polymerase III epsilon subunit (EC [Olavius algarvensis Delta 1 endosymbiont]|nr:DNA polymerase III epsilon subunit (EC [Olavius algarvensis Delta 1 endosymbiont]